MEMTFKEFAEKLYAVAPNSLWKPVKCGYRGYGTDWQRVVSAAEVTGECRLQGEKVETGGVSGGSCWDSSDPRPYSVAHSEPEIDGIDDLLAELCPQITFLQYKRMAKEACFDTETFESREYYGNCTNYIRKYVRLENLYNGLCIVGVL